MTPTEQLRESRTALVKTYINPAAGYSIFRVTSGSLCFLWSIFRMEALEASLECAMLEVSDLV